jgi:hypothetical protein
MTHQYSFDDKNLIERTLCELFPPEWLRDKAKETGLIKRERKTDPVIMFWTLAIGYGTFLQRTLAGVNGNLKFLNSGKIKFPTCKFLISRFRSYVDANREEVPHVERFIQRRFKHQRDCPANRS